MDSDVDDDVQSDGEDWSRPVAEVGTVIQPSVLNKSNTQCESMLVSKLGHKRTIIHIDIDCFYAQVEMIRNPQLRRKPLGIQQKYIIVTCNYVARERGLTKLMSIKDARETCPDLVLVNGEDLTHYREMSYKISEFLQKYTPRVERLGFDENYLDVSDMVEQRLALNDDTHQAGFVYGAETGTQVSTCSCGCHLRLAVGSRIAADIREALHEELGITCCAGIAHNKLLAKLVAGTHKPNQQTTLFPNNTSTLLSSLPKARSIPGVGWNTSKKLAEAGVHGVMDLQECDLATLTEECGATMAVTIKQLSHGVDDSPVVQYSLPQTISDEDSFRKCNTMAQTQQKIDDLLSSLLKRLVEDGRTPHTFRLTVRRAEYPKYTKRESKQCPVPAHIFQKVGKGDVSFAHEFLRKTSMSLFEKIINVKQPFHLTLINVAFAKLLQKSKSDISSFFQLPRGHERVGVEREVPSQMDVDEELSPGPVKNKISEHSSRESSTLNTEICHLNDQYVGLAGKSLESPVMSDNDTNISLNPSDQLNALVKDANSLSPHVKSDKGKIGFFKRKGTSKMDGFYKASDLLPLNTFESNERPGILSTREKHFKELSSTSDSKEETHCSKADVHSGEISSLSSTTAYEDRGLFPPPMDQTVGRTASLPDGIDADVFHQLPPDMQQDILADCRSTRSGLYTSDHSTGQERGRRQMKRRQNNSLRPSGPVSLPISDIARDECSNGLRTPEKGAIDSTDNVSPFKKKKRLFSPSKSWATALTEADDNNNMFTDSENMSKADCAAAAAAAADDDDDDDDYDDNMLIPTCNNSDQVASGKVSEQNVTPGSSSVILPWIDRFDCESTVDKVSHAAGDSLFSISHNSADFIENRKSKIHVTIPKYSSAASTSTQPPPTTPSAATIKSASTTKSASTKPSAPARHLVSTALQKCITAAESTTPLSASPCHSRGTLVAEAGGDTRTSEPVFKMMTGPAPSVPPNTDPEVFRSLPIEIQAELALQWEFKNMRSATSHMGRIRESKKKSPKSSKNTMPKSTTLFKFFRSGNKK